MADAPARETMTAKSGKRVVFEQPVLPSYRVAVYRALAEQLPGPFLLVHGRQPGLPNVEPNGFEARLHPQRTFRVFGEELFWQSAHWHYASRKRTDILLLTWNLRYLSLVPALIRARLSGVRTILFGHGYSRTSGDRFTFFRNAVARLASCVLVYNRAAAASLAEHGLPPERIFVALNSMDQNAMDAAVAQWTQDPGRLPEWRRQQQLQGVPYVLFISRITPKVRVDLLIDALAIARKSQPDLQLVIIGSGDTQPLFDHARRAGVEAAIRVIGPLYDEEQLAPYFLSAQLLAYPSAIGLSLIHAFTYGLPVVTDDNLPNHNPEIEALHPGQNGLLYRADDAADFARAILRIVQNPPVRQTMSAAARTTATTEFTLARCVAGYLNAIQPRPLANPLEP